MDSERILPAEQRINHRLEEDGEEVFAWLEGLLSRSDYENLLDPDVEFASLRNVRIFDAMAETIEDEFIRSNKTQAQEALYRAMMFAFQVAERTQPEDTTEIVAGPYFAYLRQQADPFEELHRDVRTYLKENQEIRYLLDFYNDELDEGRDRHAYTLLGAGLVFMLAERSMGERFLRGTQKPFEPEKPHSHEH